MNTTATDDPLNHIPHPGIIHEMLCELAVRERILRQQLRVSMAAHDEREQQRKVPAGDRLNTKAE